MQRCDDTTTSCPQSGEEAWSDLEDENLAERVFAHVGAWAAAVAERLSPPSGPFFRSDGRLLTDANLFSAPAEQLPNP